MRVRRVKDRTFLDYIAGQLLLSLRYPVQAQKRKVFCVFEKIQKNKNY